MTDRHYHGKFLYVHDTDGETGWEYFHVTVSPDGSRTLRALCELNDVRLTRDVIYSLDEDWQPEECFVRLAQGGSHQGSVWFRFADDGVEAEGWNRDAGRFSRRVEVARRPPIFAPHPVLCDGWQVAAYDLSAGGRQHIEGCANSSPAPDGGTGPDLSFIDKYLDYLGDEDVNVPAGTFACRKFAISWDNDHPPILIWVTGEDVQLVKARWDLLHSSYVLQSLSDPKT